LVICPDFLPAAEEKTDDDSEEENDEPELLLDEFNYPILPPRGNMPLEKSKDTLRLYGNLTYSKSFLH
jgi:hypothetical protein